MGGWLSITLKTAFEAKVFGLGLNPITGSNFFDILNVNKFIEKNFITDILNEVDVENVMQKVNPDIVFHLAAQPIVSTSYQNPIETFNTNIIGTLNVLNSIKNLEKKVNCIIITSDKCYKNLENGLPFTEDDPMGGFDPYSASKAGCEIVSESFAHSFFRDPGKPNIATARAGNIVGGGDWSHDRVVTDLVHALSNKKNIILRNPMAVRPWQHVLDVVNGYIKLGQYIDSISDSFSAFNFGPPKTHELNVEEVAKSFIAEWGGIHTLIEKPKVKEKFYESTILRLNSSKAHMELNWQTKLDQKETIKWTVDWYKDYLGKKNMRNKTIQDINNYFLI